jgi:hypothetical protein
MPTAARVSFDIQNLTFSAPNLLKGISFVMGITKRGPVADPGKLISTWDQFVRVYGGYLPNSNFALLAERAFNYGAQLRVSRVVHYNDISDPNTATATKAILSSPLILTWDSAMVAGNVFDFNLEGVASAPVNFTTDHDTTMALIAAELSTHPLISSAHVVQGPAANDDLTLILFPKKDLTLTYTLNAVITGGASQPSINVTEADGVLDSKNNKLFTPVLKYPGGDYNKVFIAISNASNGNSAYFNLTIFHEDEAELTEYYPNLKIPSTPPNIANSTYLDEVKLASQLLDFIYEDLSSLSGQLRPLNGLYFFDGGHDGSPVTSTDYIGNALGKTGFFAFDEYDDGMQVAAPEVTEALIHEAGADYAANRKDLLYLGHLPNSLSTSIAIAAARDAMNIDTPYAMLFAGGLKISHPVTGLPIEISGMGDILGIIAHSDNLAGEWYAFDGINRGTVRKALGVVNNFGTPARYTELNVLANHQVNMMVHKDKRVYLAGNYTATISNSQMSWADTIRFIIFLQKSLRPILEKYLREPCDIPTWKAIFDEVNPFLTSLVKARAMFAYVWNGDQNISRIEDVRVNTLADVQQGKYKAKLYIKKTPAMNELLVQIVLSPLSLDFNIVTD